MLHRAVLLPGEARRGELVERAASLRRQVGGDDPALRRVELGAGRSSGEQLTTRLPRRASLDRADGADQAVLVGQLGDRVVGRRRRRAVRRRRVGRHRVRPSGPSGGCVVVVGPGSDVCGGSVDAVARPTTPSAPSLVAGVDVSLGACPAETRRRLRRSSPAPSPRCVPDGGCDDSGTEAAGSADSGCRRARGLLDGRRARRHQRPQLDDAGDIDGIQRVALVAYAGQVDDDVLALDAHVGFGDAAFFELVADQVTDRLEVLLRCALLRRQHDGDAALQVEAEHRLVPGDEVDREQDDGDDDDPDERDPQTTTDHSSGSGPSRVAGWLVSGRLARGGRSGGAAPLLAPPPLSVGRRGALAAGSAAVPSVARPSTAPPQRCRPCRRWRRG